MALPHSMQPTMAEYNEPAASRVLDTAAGSKQQYQRTYQACLPCRKRKVKCDLGSPENPHDPPCARCRREQKPCAFSLTRRKRKSSVLGSDSEEEEPPEHLQRKRSARGLGPEGDGYGGSPSLPRTAIGQSPATSRPADSNVRSASYGQIEPLQDEEVHNPMAANVFGPQHVTGPNSAMQSLIHAAVTAQQEEKYNDISTTTPQSNDLHTQGRTIHRDQFGQAKKARSANHATNATMVDPAITASRDAMPEPSQQTIRMWSRLRFVRAGWFTAREAARYIEYYYLHLAPLTLVTHPDFRQIENNPELLSQEPMLAVTLLTIASRYMRVTGRGADTRSLMIHDRLWQYLQGTVTRMFWGQEQSGGGFCGAGANRTTSDITGGSEPSKLRSLGSIESLLLLSDFHPRSIHFPPGDDDGDLVASDEDGLQNNSAASDGAVDPKINEYLQMIEPINRSGKMSWSLICFAHTLAYELGVFGTYANGKLEGGGRIRSTGPPSHLEKRMDRIDRLLYIYLTQASGRFGFPGLYPKHLADQYMADAKAGFPEDPTRLNLEPPDLDLYYGTELTSLNKLCNDVLFQSQESTEKLIGTGEVVTILSDLVPRLEAWKRRLEAAPVDDDTKTLLSIEVNYFLVFVNGQGLQAWWDHFRSTYSTRHQNGDYQSPESSVSSHLSNLTDQHETYIIGCVNASREILQNVVVNLGRNGKLRHAPVRTISSITSAAIFLCKTFLRGNLRSSVNESTHLLDETIKALRKSVVDDVHLSLQWAEILDLINQRLSKCFITLPPPMNSSPSQGSFALSQSGSPAMNVTIPKTHHKRKPRAESFTTRPHPKNPGVNVVMPPPSRNMYHHQQQQQVNNTSTPINNSGVTVDNAQIGNGSNDDQYIPDYSSYPTIYPNDVNVTNANENANSNEAFSFNLNDEPWMGLSLDHAVNPRSSYMNTALNPPGLEFTSPLYLETGDSLNELLSLGMGQPPEFGDDFMQGAGDGTQGYQ